MSLTGVLNSHLMMAHLIRTFGTDEQRDDFLPKLASGELRGGLALTEPDCGTDLQAIRTTARARRRRYVVNGTKTWITNGGRRQLPRAAREDRPRRGAPQPRHVGAPRAEGRRRLHRAAQAREARLQGRRHRASCSSTTSRSPPTACSAASRDAASRRRWAASSSAASTSPRAVSASPTPRCRRRCATRT